ncbi:Ger(x)C family spore germination protein [Lentibacillus cibarius]|uniref:Ger(X)C family spore germination protein n=1 Tax=Lentibacillus cibarius TaxID=2583219 RepID=A0A549YJZ1_9BACI|nr:Ger(x)C family spore germination protein [Lentibacillus cibarius]TRM12200.1 Ger(x)C family spore germination protein [Lentibacillus cibarius]
MAVKHTIFIIFILISLVANFDLPKKVIDEIHFITAVGYDQAEKDSIRSTIVTPIFTKEGELEDLQYTDTSSTVYGTLVKLNTQSSEQLLNGKIEVALYSKELAAQGLDDYVDYLLRDPSVDANLFPVVVDGQTSNFLQQIKSKKGIGIYLKDLLEHNIRHGNLPTINLKQFDSALQSKTMDAFLPMLDMKKDDAALQKLAFFDEDQFTDSIPIKKAAVFRMLFENVEDGQYGFEKEAYKVSIQNIESVRNIIPVKKNGRTEVAINIQLRGVIREYTGNKQVISRLRKLEKDMQKDFGKKAETLIKRFQKKGIDPLNIEGHVKARNRSYDPKQFEKVYPELPVSVNVDVSLKETGTKR